MLKERGQEVGIEHFNADRVASSTLLSHRLVQWVTRTRGINQAEQLYTSLNERHFVAGQKLNSKGMLCEAAAELGIEESETKAFLESDQGFEEISRAQQMLRSAGVHSIPTFFMGGQMAVGAVRQAEFVNIFRNFESKGGAVKSIFAEALNIPAPIMEESLEIA